MKNVLTVSGIFSWPGLKPALAGLMLLGMAAYSRAAEPVVIPPSALPYGYSYEEWSAKWWQWSLGLSTKNMENVGKPAICEGPASTVRFLGGVYGFGTNVVTHKVTIAEGTPLFFSILSAEDDNTACPVSDFGTNTAAQLTAAVIGLWGQASETTCTIDGVAVEGMEDPTNSVYNVVSPAFSYTTAEKDNDLILISGEDCIPGGLTVYPAVTDGVYLMLSPLKPGHHTIKFVGTVGPLSGPFVDDEGTYEIEVVSP
ncbi:MAG TPA: hypothetical protein VMR33_05605 [Candidatus Baltobacteraceae bacterium]|nr:hypothetical protein [Candidatus Baltobacteraceae bacterium]